MNADQEQQNKQQKNEKQEEEQENSSQQQQETELELAEEEQEAKKEAGEQEIEEKQDDELQLDHQDPVFMPPGVLVCMRFSPMALVMLAKKDMTVRNMQSQLNIAEEDADQWRKVDLTEWPDLSKYETIFGRVAAMVDLETAKELCTHWNNVMHMLAGKDPLSERVEPMARWSTTPEHLASFFRHGKTADLHDATVRLQKIVSRVAINALKQTRALKAKKDEDREYSELKSNFDRKRVKADEGKKKNKKRAVEQEEIEQKDEDQEEQEEEAQY